MKKYFCLGISLSIMILNLGVNSAIAGLFGRPDFFEKGQEQFEEEIRRFERGDQTPNPNIDKITLPWSRIINQTSGFTLMMPPGNILQEVEIVEAPEGDIQFDIIASHPENSRYVIAYSEELPPERFQDSQTVLSKATNSIAKNNVDLIKAKEEDIAFDEYPGKQFELKNQEEMIIFRLILVEQRLYVLAVNQQNDNLSEELVNNFFNSFELIESAE